MKQANWFRLLALCCVFLISLFLSTTIASAACMPTIKHVTDSMSPPNPAAGSSATVTYTVTNVSTTCDANGYKLAFHSVLPATPECLSGNYSGSNPSFSLAANATGQVTANIPAVPPETAGCLVYFDILDASGSPLPLLPGGRMYATFGTMTGPGPGLCVGPTPVINSADHVDMGDGEAAASANVENATEKPTLEIGSSSTEMDEGSDGQYNGGDSTAQGKNSGAITAFGMCNMTATFGYNFLSFLSRYFGKGACAESCDGYQGCAGDPVNTAIGNFVYDETDATVAGPGDSTIKLNRTYNSQAVLWTPASITRFYPDGSDEVVAEPPQYFGKGWTSELGQFLLEIDMAPTFEGVQILYPDGHTANFEKSGAKYVSVSPGTHDVITKEGGEYILRDADCGCASEEKRFDSNGHLTALIDRNGNAIRLFYDGDKLSTLENAAGRRIEFTLNGDGQIIKADLPENITLQYEYQDDLLSAFIDGRGNRTEYRYDELGQMTEIISANGYPLVRNIYDDEYRVTQQIVKESESYSFSYEEGKTTVTDAYGNAHVHHYDDDLRLVRMEYPDGTEERYEYDEDQNRTGYTNQAGGQWQWTYDDTGNRLTAEGPLGWYRDWAYNERRQVTRMTEKVDASTQRTSTFIYDEHGNLTKFCNALNACGFVIYDERGLPLRMTDLNSYTTVNTYDTEGDLISVLDPEGAITGFDHDDLGRVTGKTKPLGNSYSYSYDENSNLTSVDGPLGFHLGYSYDANDNLMQSVDPNGGTINYTYTKSDSPKEIYNQLNFKTSFSYGLMNERTGMTDAEDRVWSYAYNNMLQVTDVNGPLGHHQGFIYNALGMITDATDPEGRVKHIEYDALKRPLTITRNYVAGGVENSDTNVSTSFTYNLIGDRLSVTDPEGYISKAEYDLQSRLLKKQDAEGYAWEYSYDPMGNLLEKLNPRNFTTSYAYTPTNRLQSVTNPEQHIKSFTYNPNGSLIAATDPKGTVSEYAYDELDRKIAQVRNSNLSAPADYETNVTTAFAYDLAGNLRFVTNPLDYRKEIRYDAAHRKVELIDYEEGSTTFQYDKVNNLLKVTDAEGNSTNYTVDELNRLVAVTNAENETTRYTYDLVGNRTQRIEADNTVTLYELDGVYRLNRVQENYRPDRDPGNDVNVLTTYGYDRRGLLTSFINANGAETAFAYNGVGKLTRETDPLLKVWEYAYDGNRNRITRQDAKGNLTEYDFYPDDMLMRMAYADGTVVSYAYDANNNRTAMNDTLGDTSWNFDPLNRVTQQDDPFDRILHYQYDAASNRVGITYPDENQVGYAYSPNNWLQNMTVRARHAVPLQTEYARDLVGNLTEIDNPNQTRTTVAYDKVYRTLKRRNWQTTKGGKVNSGFAYSYNKVGHITKAIKEYGWRKPSTVVETYGYDGLHRLSEFVTAKNNPFTAVLPSMQIITGNRPVDAIATSYSYDPVGNRLSWESTDNLQTNTPLDGFSRKYAYNEANQMLGMEYFTEKNSTKDHAYAYSYDENGNRINRQLIDKNGPQYGVDYSYDAENRLVAALDYQITSRNGKNRIERAMTHYEYDGGGRRLVQHYDPKNGGVGVDKRDEYVFDGLDPVAEYDILNGQRTDYYRGAGNHLALMHHYKGGTQGQMYWYHYNHKGDVVGLTKQNGNSHHNYRYDPYGAVLPENGNFTDPHNHYTLTGKEFDENTGLVWFGARFYEPESGVWVNQDTYRGRLSEPGSLHRFGYVADNPVTFWDWYGWKNEKHYCPDGCKKGYRDLTREALQSFNASDSIVKTVGAANKIMDKPIDEGGHPASKGGKLLYPEYHAKGTDGEGAGWRKKAARYAEEQMEKAVECAILARKTGQSKFMEQAFIHIGRGLHVVQDAQFNPYDKEKGYDGLFETLEYTAIQKSVYYLEEFEYRVGFNPFVESSYQ